jgi:ABC-type polar amino acid transport system ATPase subunit
MIQVSHLKKSHGTLGVLRDVSVDIPKGDVAVIIGPSGCGKSTFLRCLNGLETFDGGAISVGDVTLSPDLSAEAYTQRLAMMRRKMGMVFQQFHLFPHLSVLQNLIEAPVRVLGADARAAREKAERLLDRVGVLAKAHEKPARLSGGEQQRVAIARALAMDPQVMLFDEPTSALDPGLCHEVLHVLQDLARGGQTMVIVTHDMAFARKVATTVHVFGNGMVERSGDPESILCDAEPEVVLAPVRPSKRTMVRSATRQRVRRYRH